MNLSEKIKNLIKEGELYRAQGLLTEALSSYKEAAAILKKVKIKNKDAWLKKLSSIISDLKTELKKVQAPRKPPRVPEAAQALMKDMFSLDDPRIKGSATMGGAIALAEFGQFEKAVDEFSLLLDRDSLRLEAARNILKYSLRFEKPDAVVNRLKFFAADQRFSEKEIDSLKSYLQDLFKQQGIDADISMEAQEGAKPVSEVSDDDVIDIGAIRLTLARGPKKGENIELEINFQQGKQLNIIIPKKDKDIAEGFVKGSIIENVEFYSPIAIFSGTAYVSERMTISSGPKRGDFSVNITILKING